DEEQGVGWIEGHVDAALDALVVRSAALGVGLGVDAPQRERAPLVLDPRRALGVEERAGDGDHLAREEALLELPLDAADAQRSVAADATACAAVRRAVELALGRGAWLRSPALDALARALAHAAAVRRAVVGAAEPREQAPLHVVERAVLAEVIEALLAQRAPEALHLAARLGVV